MDNQLSIIINVKNGEPCIERCLTSLTRFTDVVLFDNYSTDKTLEIASTFSNVRVIQHEFCGMGRVRNLAAKQAKYDWVFFVDCDEVLHPDLVDALLNLRFRSGTVYSVLRHNFYANSWINSSAWENDWVVRLYNRGETFYSDLQVHESVIQDNLKLEQIISGIIYHFPYSQISQLIDKMQTYSSWYARQNYPTRRPQVFLIPFRAFFMFIKCYILKRGFLDGFAGFAISSYNAIGVFSKYMKLAELYDQCSLGLVCRVKSIDELSALVKNISSQKRLPHHMYILLDQSLLNDIDPMELNHYLSELCVPNMAIGIPSEDDANWYEYIKHVEHLDYLIYLEDNSLLANINLLKSYKKNILANHKLDKVQLINLR